MPVPPFWLVMVMIFALHRKNLHGVYATLKFVNGRDLYSRLVTGGSMRFQGDHRSDASSHEETNPDQSENQLDGQK